MAAFAALLELVGRRWTRSGWRTRYKPGGESFRFASCGNQHQHGQICMVGRHHSFGSCEILGV